MKIKDILARFPQLDRDTLDYWERQGYIEADRKREGNRTIREYPPDEVKRIRVINKFYQAGFPPREAVKKADKRLKESNESIRESIYLDEKPISDAVEQIFEDKVDKTPVFSPNTNITVDSKIYSLLENNYLSFRFDHLEFIADELIDLTEKILEQVDSIVVLNNPSSVVAGALSVKARRRDIVPPTIIPWEERKKRNLEKQVVLLFQTNVNDSSALFDVIKKLENLNCEVKCVVAIVCSQDAQDNITERGYSVQKLVGLWELL